MKKYLSVIFCLLAVSSLNAQSLSFNEGEIVNPQYTDTIPFEFVAAKILIPVKIGGKVRKFILDTGATLIINEPLQAEMNFPELGQIKTTDVNNQSNQQSRVRVPEFQLGALTFQGFPGIVIDLSSSLISCFEADGFIGSNCLRNSIVDIQFDRKEIIISNRLQDLDLEKKYASKMKLGNSQSTPFIAVDITDKQYEWLVFDSGSDDFYSMHQGIFEKIKKNQSYIIAKGKGATSSGVYGLEEEAQKYLLALPDFKINKTSFPNIIVNTEADSRSRIGSGLLPYGRVTLDYIHKRFYFKPYAETDSVYAIPNLGFALKSENDSVKVGLVWEPSPAYNAGLRAGQALLQIGDYKVVGKDICQMLFELSTYEYKRRRRLQVIYLDAQGQAQTVFLVQD